MRQCRDLWVESHPEWKFQRTFRSQGFGVGNRGGQGFVATCCNFMDFGSVIHEGHWWFDPILFFFPYRFPSTRSTFTSDPWSWRHVDFEGHRFSAEPRRPPAFEPRVFLDRLLSNCWLRMDTSNILSSFLKAQGPYDNIAVMVAWFGTARQPGRNGLWHNWRQLRRNWRRLVMCRVAVLDVHGILNLRTSSKISSGLFEVHYRLCIFFCVNLV